MDNLDVVTRLIATIGFPGALLLLLLWGGVKVVRWLGPNAVQPMVQRFTHFVDALEARLGQVSESQAEIKQRLATVCRYPGPCSQQSSQQAPLGEQFAARPAQRGADM